MSGSNCIVPTRKRTTHKYRPASNPNQAKRNTNNYKKLLPNSTNSCYISAHMVRSELQDWWSPSRSFSSPRATLGGCRDGRGGDQKNREKSEPKAVCTPEGPFHNTIGRAP